MIELDKTRVRFFVIGGRDPNPMLDILTYDVPRKGEELRGDGQIFEVIRVERGYRHTPDGGLMAWADLYVAFVRSTTPAATTGPQSGQ